MPNMIESLAQTRHAERYSAVQAAAAHGELPGKLHATRIRAGWLLVGLGLRLAMPSCEDAGRRTTLLRR